MGLESAMRLHCGPHRHSGHVLAENTLTVNIRELGSAPWALRMPRTGPQGAGRPSEEKDMWGPLQCTAKRQHTQSTASTVYTPTLLHTQRMAGRGRWPRP